MDNYNSISPYIKQMYTNTWFSQESLPGVINTHRGCMAGMTLSDLIYATVVVNKIGVVKKCMVDEGLCPQFLPPQARDNIFDAAYFDDVISPVVGEAEEIVATTVSIV